MMEQYIETLLRMDKVCTEFKKAVIASVFKNRTAILTQGLFCYSPWYQSYLRPIKGLIEVIELFGIEVLEINKKPLLETIRNLENPIYAKNRQDFQGRIDKILELFSDKDIKKKIENRLSILNSAEIGRLNEAIHCFLEDCNYSAVAISVSAIEFRLLSLMSSINPDPKLEKMTLGQLVNEYLKNKDKYRKIVPKKHEPLLEHCNTYRIFSVHPKKEKINKSVATSILHMTFQFLLDKKLIKKVKS